MITTAAVIIAELVKIQDLIDGQPAGTIPEQVALAVLESFRADLITDLYAAVGNPEALPAAQEQFAVRQFARRVADELQDRFGNAKAAHCKAAIRRAQETLIAAAER